MSEFAAIQIPKPSDEQAFERCSELLWRCILQDDGVQIHGRRGQRQNGVDLFGIRDGDPNQIVGVQCKLKSDGKILKEDEVRNEVEKALNFRPRLSEYYIVTTAPDDANLNQLSLDLSDISSEGREKNIKIRVWGWHTLEREIRRHPRAIQAFDPSYMLEIDQIKQGMLRIEYALRDSNVSINPAVSNSNARIEIERLINEYVGLIPSSPDKALDLFYTLQNGLDVDAASTIRFRIANNIAACQLTLGEEQSAAQAFISAYDFDPKNPKAIANKALGLFIQDNWPSLKEFAEIQLSRYPDNAALAAYYIQGMKNDNAIEDPLVHVPDTVLGTPEVSEAHVRWLINRGEHGAWRDAAVAAHELHPDNEALKGIYADAVLDRLLGEASFQYGRSFSVSERADIDAAIAIYELRWEQLRNSAQYARVTAIDVPLNLMLAYSILQQYDKSLTIGQEVLTRFPSHLEVKKYMAAALLETGDFNRAMDLLHELEVDSNIVMMRFKIHMVDNDWHAVSELTDTYMETFPEADRGMALAGRVRANVELAPNEERRTILEAELDNFEGDTRALVMLAQVSRLHRFEDLTSSFFNAAQAALNSGDAKLPSRIMLAQEAAERGDDAVTADILFGHLDLDRDNRVLRLLAKALVNDLPIRARAVSFFKGLSPEIQRLPFYQSAEGFLHMNHGNPQEAIPLFMAVFENERSIDNLDNLIAAYFRVDDREAIAELLQSNDLNSLPGSPPARLNVCHLLIEFDEVQNALDMAYQALIDGTNDAETVMTYIGIVFKATQNHTNEFENRVEPGVWVRLTSNMGVIYEVLLDEDADRPWGEKADSSNGFYRKALGLNTGDEFTHVNLTTGISEIWTISEIKPRWLQAFEHLSMNFGQRFPEARGFARVPIPDGDIEQILEMVRRKSEESYNLANLYLVNNIPIAFLASNIPGYSIGFAQYLVSIGKCVSVCTGSEDEINEALGLIQTNNHSGAVLDALTAWYAADLGVFPVLEEQLGPLTIPATEFSCLKSMLNNFMGGEDEEMMGLSYRDGEYSRHVITPEEYTVRRELIESRIETIKETCSIEPVVIPDNLTEAGEQLMEPPFSDAVSPAVIAGQDRLLLCEDMVMRQLASSVFGTKSIWIQTVLWSALQDGTMTLDEYSDALVQLAKIRHGFMPVSEYVLLSVLMRDNSDDLLQFQDLCNYLGSGIAEPASYIMVASQFINTLWVNYLTDENKVRTATQIVLHSLLTRNSEHQAQQVTRLATTLNQRPRDYFVEWCQKNGVAVD